MPEILSGYLQSLIFVPIAFIFAYIAKIVYDMMNRGSYDANEEIVEKSNLALGFRRAGLYLAVPLGMFGSLSGTATDLMSDILNTALEGAVIVVLLIIAKWSIDLLMLSGINNTEEIKKGNVAVGVFEFFAYVATGLILLFSFAGEGGGLLNAVVFFVLGQLALVVLGRIYELVTPFDERKEIQAGNVSAAILIGGTLLSLSILLGFSIGGDFVSWAEDLSSFALSAGLGIITLVVLQKVIDIFFLPKTDLATEIERDKNTAGAVLTIAPQLAFALLIAVLIIG